MTSYQRTFGILTGKSIQQISKKHNFTEKSLTEMGFDLMQINNWDDLVQPGKADLMELLEKMIKNYEKTNVQIQIDDASFNCHMIVLQCYSEFFHSLTNEQLIILPSDKVTPQAFIMIYDWMLSTKPVVQREGILELFNAAKFLRIKQLVHQCWTCLDDDTIFAEERAFLLYLDARKYDLVCLEQLMLSRISKFFLTLVASREFLELSVNEIKILLKSNTIGVNSETEVLMSAIRWLTHDWDERKQYVIDVIQCVRFGHMTPWQLVTLKRGSESEKIKQIIEIPEIQKMIEEAIYYVSTKYWYPTDPESATHILENLELTEPAERYWVRDKTWSKNIKCPNQMYNSYDAFLEYLEVIRNMGKDYWKTLESYEGNPNALTNIEGVSCYSSDINGKRKSTSMPIMSTRKPDKRKHKNSNKKLTNLADNDDKRSGDSNIRNVHFQQSIRNCPDSSKLLYKNHLPIINSVNNSLIPDATEQKIDDKIISAKNNHQNVATSSNCYQLKHECSDAQKCNDISELEVNETNDDESDEELTVFNSIKPQFLTEDNQVDEQSDSKLVIVESEKFDNSSPQVLDTLENKKILVFGGINQNNSTEIGQRVLCYIPDSNKWKYINQMPKARHRHSTVVFQDKIYLAGGSFNEKNKSRITSTMWSFNSIQCTWHSENGMPYPRQDFAFVTIHLQIYAIGGEDKEKNSLKSILCYDPVNRKWTEMSEMATPRIGPAVTVHKNKIWVAGGFICKKDKNIAKTIEYYDPLTGHWTQLNCELRIPRAFSKMFSYSGFLYCIGGLTLNQKNQKFSCTSSFEYLKQSMDTWECLDELTVARYGHDIVLHEQYLFIIGGSSFNRKTLNSVECFDMKRLLWIDGIAPLELSGMSALIL